ncbi:hypothetical protein DSUL_50164 [Desulfovibrionales bacterium]
MFDSVQVRCCIRISVYLYICISVYLYICISVYLYICISVYLYICGGVPRCHGGLVYAIKYNHNSLFVASIDERLPKIMSLHGLLVVV